MTPEETLAIPSTQGFIPCFIAESGGDIQCRIDLFNYYEELPNQN
jgi:hypothetical protein